MAGKSKDKPKDKLSKEAIRLLKNYPYLNRKKDGLLAEEFVKIKARKEKLDAKINDLLDGNKVDIPPYALQKMSTNINGIYYKLLNRLQDINSRERQFHFKSSTQPHESGTTINVNTSRSGKNPTKEDKKFARSLYN